MNALPLTLSSARVAAVLALLSGVTAFAGSPSGGAGGDPTFRMPAETQRDMGAGFERLHEEALRLLSDPNANAKIFKFDIDADINHDGIINDSDNGWMEATPPGMVLRVGEKAQVRVTLFSHFPYFPGSAVARLSLAGINRGTPTGEFASFEEEVHNTAHIIVWSDASKSRKLLDSADAGKRVVEWIIHPGYVLPDHTGVPTNVYVEAVSPSGQYAGDVRLMAVITPLEVPNLPFYKFRVSEDHLLFTVK
ncbi:MAG: hypothetical protein JWO89_3040 [Verrucomicrobiaceae bacterium]|nr:hypothetical protein [Verrucomicrobiaceae bacterium]MDB6120971.1 hypothetical protein [Verrucomicrobiaceae bacterium]